jgi:hypothetical protein
MDVQPEIHYPAPETPNYDRRFRKSNVPGEITVFHSLKDQKLPGEEFRYGIRGNRGSSTEQCMKAGQKFGIEAHQMWCKEQVYESNKREPIGKAHIRGHKLKMLPEGFGNASGVPEDCKAVVFPVEQPRDSEEVRLQYKKSHNHFDPGERIERNYNWPEASKDEFFRFGTSSDQLKDGAGSKMALNLMCEDDGSFKQTKMVQKVAEDYRNVVQPKFAAKVHHMQGPNGPPMDPDWAYGVKSITSDCTARSCILGYYSVDEQLPDQDLGRCGKPGRRNVTGEQRAFGVPSVRTDLACPPGRRSVADLTNYGTECGAAAVLNPQRFDDRGIPDREFLLRRAKEQLRSLVDACGGGMNAASLDYDEIWEQAVNLFDDGIELVSLDAFLHIYSQKVDNNISTRLAGPCGPLTKALSA